MNARLAARIYETARERLCIGIRLTVALHDDRSMAIQIFTSPREELIQLLRAHGVDLRRLGVKSLDVFGSHARGEAQPDSDSDLLVEFEGSATFDRFMDLKELHARIVWAIENVYAGRITERVEELCHHALRAQSWAQAVEYLQQAGVKAYEQSANRPAAAAFEQALSAIAHLPQTRPIIEQTVDLCLAMRPCVTPLADMKRLLASAQHAAPLLASLGDAKREALTLGYQAAALVNLGRTQEGSALAERALNLAELLADPLVRTSAYFFLGQARMRVARFREAIESFERDAGISADGLIALSSDAGGGGTLDARSALSSCVFSDIEGAEAYCALGSYEAAQGRAQEAWRIAQGIGIVYFRALAEMGLGLAHLSRGEIRTAIPLLEHAHELGEAADFPGLIIHAACGLGPAYNLTDRTDEAAQVLERGWVLAKAGGFMHYGVICLTHLAEAFSLAGRNDRASGCIERALGTAVESSFGARVASALQVRARIRARGCETDAGAALQDYEAARSLAHELGMRPLVAHCHLGLGRVYAGAGDREQAREHLHTALAMYRDMEMHHWPEQAESALRAL
jgi:tetratricopeptide (TPR) repeat protein